MGCANINENRKAFFDRIRPLLSYREYKMVELAYILCKEQFRSKRRKGEKDPKTGLPLRAFEHPRRVSLILIDEFGCVDYRMIIAAILHDADEDTRDLKVEAIEIWFDKRIAKMVRRLSKQEFADGSKDLGYTERLIKYGDWKEIVIKCCDRLDNLRSLKGCDKKFIAKQVAETNEKYLELHDLMVERVPKRYRQSAEDLREKVHETLEELAVLLQTDIVIEIMPKQ